jgi:triacylglycerol lipase
MHPSPTLTQGLQRPLSPGRRRVLLGAGSLAVALALSACASFTPSAESRPPIVFVHGNGDSAALWLTTLWRFESQGWPRDRLVAVDLPYPLARDDDTVAQAGRSSAAEQAQALARTVDRVLARTGAKQVVLVGNSRGGNAIRNYVQNHGGAAKVSHAVLGGTPNHGVQADPAVNPRNEFNGAGTFLTGLNSPKGANGDEVTPGVRWMTLRSDNNDKFAQPDGRWIGRAGKPTYVGFDGPALKGAHNVVLPGRDHREVSYHPQAFVQTWTFITGQAPPNDRIEPEATVVLDGQVGAPGPAGPSNLGLAGATVEVHAVDATTGARRGPPLHRQTTGADGYWGPMQTGPTQALEFVVQAPGQATLHVYRSAFPRSSQVVHFRPERLSDADKAAQAVVNFTRPRGYFGLPRDRIELDGQQPAPGIPAGVAGVAASRLRLADASDRPVVAAFESGVIRERVVGRTWPVQQNHLVVLEMHE